MSKPILISIPHPCTQNRDEMTHTSDGRFCAHCQKTVIDFTTWTDAALYNFFSKNTGNVCGTFFRVQLNHAINIPYQPNSRLYRLTIALGLALIFTQSSDALAQNDPPKTEQTSLLKQPKPSGGQLGQISGKVVDEKKEALPGAVIQVFKDSILTGGTVTDIEGNFSISDLKQGTYKVVVVFIGYDNVIVNDIVVSNDTNVKFNFAMRINHNVKLQGELIITKYKKPLIDMDNPDKRTFTHDDINHIPH